jgi:GNAT superfamily N-acetyltransferase
VIEVRRIYYSPVLFAELIEEAPRAGGSFLLRLRDEWESGANRFEDDGEALFGAFDGERLVGVGGLNRDPWQPELGRLRHLYVLAACRGRGAGRTLSERILAQARGRFDVVRLRTRASEAVALYLRLGFVPSVGEHETHRVVLA